MSLAAMAACVALASCSNEDEPSVNVDGVKALTQVSVGIKTQNSRAGITAGSFSGTESLGLFIFGGEGIDDATILKAAYKFWFEDKDWHNGNKIWEYMKIAKRKS